MARRASKGTADMMCGNVRLLVALAATTMVLLGPEAMAEPYLAIYKGMQCSSCHSHTAGGGMRTAYGNVFAQSELAARRMGDSNGDVWTGEMNKWLSVGANLRGSYRFDDVPNSDSQGEFSVTRGTIYVEARLIANRLSLYIDQQLAPNASQNREAYLKFKGASGKSQFLAGQFYLPYGLRLQDDTAFVRQVTGINFTNPDRGVQYSYESGPWSSQVSVTNGSGGGNEIDSGKQLSAVTNFVRQNWRIGGSINVNDADAGDRQMANIFAGVKTGPVVWLAQADWISDEIADQEDQNGIAGYVEANWMIRKGQSLKFGYDYFDPDDDIDEDHQVRYSLVWEYNPMQFVQGRFGVRVYDGPPQSDLANRDEFFAELHGFF